MIEENVLSDLGMYLLGQVHLSGPSVPNEPSKNYCKVSNVHIKGHVLVGQNGGSTLPLLVLACQGSLASLDIAH